MCLISLISKELMTDFVVITNRRSGSTALMNLIQSHPEVFAQHETMGGAKRQGHGYAFVKSELDRFYDITAFKNREVTKASGWKVLYEQMYEPIAQYIREKPLKIVQLIRNDLLETALWVRGITEYDARHRNILEQYGKVEVNIENCIFYIEQLRKNIDFWHKKADFTLFYEGDITEHGESVSEFFNKQKRAEFLKFLGVSDFDLTNIRPKKSKLVHESHDVVSNYEELLKEMESRGVKRYYIIR